MTISRITALLPRAVAAIAVLLYATAASAHPGAGGHASVGFLAGFVHPLTGADHLVAMLAVGAWGAIAVRPAWLAPAAFAACLALGALAGAAGARVPAVEPMIALSLLVAGLLVARRQSLPWPAAAAIAGTFAFFHGAAHGAELPHAAPLAGMLLASAGLLGAGMALARLAQRKPSLITACGVGAGAFGAALLAQLA
jgi:urease accessory protein